MKTYQAGVGVDTVTEFMRNSPGFGSSYMSYQILVINFCIRGPGSSQGWYTY